MARLKVSFVVDVPDGQEGRYKEVLRGFGVLAEHRQRIDKPGWAELWRINDYLYGALCLPAPNRARTPVPGVRTWPIAGDWETRVKKEVLPAICAGLGAAEVVEVKVPVPVKKPAEVKDGTSKA